MVVQISVILVYVNDIILAGIDLQVLDDKFKIKDFDDLKFFSRLEVVRTKAGISLCQCKYTLDIINDCGCLNCKPSSAPMASRPNLVLILAHLWMIFFSIG